jgi:hypothetical protein
VRGEEEYCLAGGSGGRCRVAQVISVLASLLRMTAGSRRCLLFLFSSLVEIS